MYSLFAFTIDHTLLDYECAVISQDFEAANQYLSFVPHSQYDRLARFLRSQEFLQPALELAQDPALRFDLALDLGDYEVLLPSLPYH